MASPSHTVLQRTVFQRAVAIVTLALFTASCATTNLPPISAVGDGFQPLRDELALWEQSRAEEDKLLGEVTLYEDPLLEDYLAGVVARLNPPQMAANPSVTYRVRVVADPTLNAFAYPHGSLYVHTGLVARMESEDHIATVLGHEMTHVENRHMLRYRRAAQNRQVGFAVAAVAAAVVLAGEEGEAYEAGDWSRGATIGVLGDLLIGLGLQLAFLAAVNGYGRDLEQEADYGGFAKVAAAGYDPAVGPDVYQALLDDHGEPSSLEGFFFGSHPKLSARVENAKLWLAEHPSAGDATGEGAGGEEPAGDATDDFSRRIRPVVRDDAALNLEAGRLKIAEDQLARALEWMPEDPQSHLLLGRLRQAQAEVEADPALAAERLAEAQAALREAIRLDADRPEPHRELGLLLYRAGDRPAACLAFGHYLELDPDSDDAGSFRDYVLELELDGDC
jgi:predicted Zn-dependent protease